MAVSGGCLRRMVDERQLVRRVSGGVGVMGTFLGKSPTRLRFPETPLVADPRPVFHVGVDGYRPFMNDHITPISDDLLARPQLSDLAETDRADQTRFARRSARYLHDVGLRRNQIRVALRNELGLSDYQVALATAGLPRAA